MVSSIMMNNVFKISVDYREHASNEGLGGVKNGHGREGQMYETS